jgi:hypothetical protein
MVNLMWEGGFMGKRVSVTRESKTGRNEQFRDNSTGRNMSRGAFADKIDDGLYPSYHVRIVGGKRTPTSNPDGSEGNNLG